VLNTTLRAKLAAGLEQSGFDRMDRVNGGLRILAALTILSYPLFYDHSQRKVLFAVLGFVGYSAALYLGLWRPIVKRFSKAHFYVLTAAIDLVFTVYIIWITGAAVSPFFRALYLWVAMLAFFFGLRGGSIASMVAMLILTYFLMQSPTAVGTWERLIKLGGLVMHGPLIGRLVDIMRRRALELEQAQAQLLKEQSHTLRLEKLTSMGLIAAGLAHEINNPLQGAVGALHALRRDSLPEERRAPYLDIVEVALERMRVTIAGLLDYSRKGPVSTSRIAVSEAVEQALMLLSPMFNKAGVRIDNRVAGLQDLISADRSRLQQALTNVLINALHASKRGGQVEVSLTRREGRLGICISDQGAGIPREHLDQVCDPFFTTKPTGVGTGLGLAITLRILQNHGGDLELANNVGKGASVTLWLPGSDGEGSC
jgi:signal transduction histidine kinase